MDSKLLISIKRLGKRVLAIIKDILAVVGILVMIAETVNNIFGYNGLFEFYREYICCISIIIILACIIKNWDNLKISVKIADSSDVTISLMVRDVLKNKGAIIIPTNTTFDTTMDDEFISKGSIQGQYQTKYFKGNLSSLDDKIEEGLKGKKYTQINDGRSTKTKRYKVGTVCRISNNNKRAYFLADSDINARGIPIDADASNISQALVGLWDSLVLEGNHEPYSIPLLGTGKARVKDASREEVVREIIVSFLAASKDHKITENLMICIHPKDYEKINWDRLCEFLKYQGLYANLKPFITKPEGVEEVTESVVKLSDEMICNHENDELNDNESNSASFESGFTEKELMMISILRGNEMGIYDIAEAMGISVDEAQRTLKRMIEGKIIQRDLSKPEIMYSLINKRKE